MSRTITQYRPAYFDGFDTRVDEVNSTAELLALPYVARWTTEPAFHRFSQSANHLMAELKGGREWWVVAIIGGGDVGFPDLPTWVAIRDARHPEPV